MASTRTLSIFSALGAPSPPAFRPGLESTSGAPLVINPLNLDMSFPGLQITDLETPQTP